MRRPSETTSPRLKRASDNQSTLTKACCSLVTTIPHLQVPSSQSYDRCNEHEREVAVVALCDLCPTFLPLDLEVAIPHRPPTCWRPPHTEQHRSESTNILWKQYSSSPTCLVRSRNTETRLQAYSLACSSRRDSSRESGIYSIPSSSLVTIITRLGKY